VDPTTADIAVAVYDLDEIAVRLADGADYDGLTALIAADLAPAQLGSAEPSTLPGHNVDTPDTLPKALEADPDLRRLTPADHAAAEQLASPDDTPRPDPDTDAHAASQAPAARTASPSSNDAGATVAATPATRQAIDELLSTDPTMTVTAIAAKIGRTPRTVYRNLPKRARHPS
ncbi:hypothetical protein ABT369_57005, partial [Dactylosporangium sp. NPDC000244]